MKNDTKKTLRIGGKGELELPVGSDGRRGDDSLGREEVYDEQDRLIREGDEFEVSVTIDMMERNVSKVNIRLC